MMAGASDVNDLIQKVRPMGPIAPTCLATFRIPTALRGSSMHRETNSHCV